MGSRHGVIRTDHGVTVRTTHAPGCEGCEQIKRLLTSEGVAVARAAYLAGDWDALERALGIGPGPGDGAVVKAADLRDRVAVQSQPDHGEEPTS